MTRKVVLFYGYRLVLPDQRTMDLDRPAIPAAREIVPHVHARDFWHVEQDVIVPRATNMLYLTWTVSQSCIHPFQLVAQDKFLSTA